MCQLRGALRVYPYVTNHALLQKWSLLSLLPSGSHFYIQINQCSSQPGPRFSSLQHPPLSPYGGHIWKRNMTSAGYMEEDTWISKSWINPLSYRHHPFLCIYIYFEGRQINIKTCNMNNKYNVISPWIILAYLSYLYLYLYQFTK